MRDLTTPSRNAPEACLDMMNFGMNWSDWRDSLRETVNAAREIDPSDRNVILVVEDMIDFLAQRVCSGSPEEKIVAELWDRAGPTEREALARIFLRMIDTGPTVSP
jgi:hypothetical protein